MRKAIALLVGLCSVFLCAATYNVFSPGGALSGTWNSQNVNVGAGSPFITGLLPAANFGAGTATGAVDWSETQTFSKVRTSGNTPGAWLSSTTPILGFNATNAPAGSRSMFLDGSGAALCLQLTNDALTVNNPAWCQLRTNNTPTDFQIYGPTHIVGSVGGSFISSATSNGSFIVGSTTAATGVGAVAHIIATGVRNTLAVKGDSATAPVVANWNADTSGDNRFVEFGTEGSFTARGSITYNRAAGLLMVNTTSDRNLKRNIRDSPASGQVIDSLKIRQFEWIDSGVHLDYWLVAQEVQEVAPYAAPDGTSVDTSKLVPLLIKEVQSLRLRVSDLEAQSIRNRSTKNESNFKPSKSDGFYFYPGRVRDAGAIDGVQREPSHCVRFQRHIPLRY